MALWISPALACFIEIVKIISRYNIKKNMQINLFACISFFINLRSLLFEEKFLIFVCLLSESLNINF